MKVGPRLNATSQEQAAPAAPAGEAAARIEQRPAPPPTVTPQVTAQGSLVAPTSADAPAFGGGLPPPLLEHRLAATHAALSALEAAPLPDTPEQLVGWYRTLGLAVAQSEACLHSALDALDARTGGGRAVPAAPFEAVRAQAFAGLRRAGALFAHVEPAFARIVHGDRSWPNQPIAAAQDRGDGRPLYLYADTFKHAERQPAEERQAEYQQRVQRFASTGGRFEDLLVAQPGLFEALETGRHYDYAMLEDGTMRLTPLPHEGETLPKCGHSLLAVGGPEFREQPVLCAGELWVLRDTAGDVEAVVVANNSGHFKPSFEDLVNTLPHLEQLGVTRDKIVLFGGPNKLPAIFEEVAERYPELDLSHALPPSPEALLAEMARTYSPLAVRAQS